MQTIRVTQVTEIEVSDENAKMLLHELEWYSQNKLPVSSGTLGILDAKVINFETTITRPNFTLSDLEKSGEII